MMYTITREEYKDIHNGICELYSLKQLVTGVIHPDLVQKLNRAFDLLEKGYGSARKQENQEFDDKMNLFEEIRKLNGFRTVWSIFDFDMKEGFTHRPGYTATQIMLESFDCTVYGTLSPNPNLLELWAAADKLVKQADDYHIFIEGFRQSEDGKFLSVCLGS